MVYTSGGLVEASDYNALINTINNVFGTGFGNSGYGGNSSNVPLANLTTVASANLITANDWRNLRNAFADCASHQGTTLPDGLPALSLLDIGDIVTFFAQLNSTPNNNAVTNNRLNVGAGNTTISTKLTNQRTTPWSNFIRHEFDVTFGSPNNARFFFNTGGAIRISASRTGGSASPQNTSWSGALTANSPFIFTGTDYFALTGSFVVLRSVVAASGGSSIYYTSNLWTISARRVDTVGPNGSNGSIIRFRSDFLDGHSNAFFDSVDGTFTSTIEERRSTGVFVRPSPTFTTITSLAAGS